MIFPKIETPKANPTKGSYLRYTGKSPVNHIIYPALKPGLIEERVDATPDLSGSLRFGPSIENTSEIDDFSNPPDLIERFAPIIQTYLPKIDKKKLIIDQTGIRPKILSKNSCYEDFLFEWAEYTGWLNLWGVDSPGLTSSIAIGEHVYNMFKANNIL